MPTTPLTAVILCGGKGQRLKPFTDTLPKALVPLNDKPLLLHLLETLDARGVRRFILCTGYQATAIEEFARQLADRPWEITCSNSGDASMTDRVLDARERFPFDRALICYGDTLANVDVKALVETHETSGAAATLTVHPFVSPFGIVEFDEGHRISRFREKPTLPFWINIGFLLCEKTALDLIERGGDMIEFLTQLSASRNVGVYKHTGKHLTVNTEKERLEAERQVHIFTVPEGD